MSGPRHDVHISLPSWMGDVLRPVASLPGDEEAMRLAIRLAHENVEHRSGGPFGAVVYEQQTGRLLAAGVNSVERLGNSMLHAEVMALMLAQAAVGSYTLRATQSSQRVLVTSCDPCAMCLGAILWSGVQRVVCGAGRADAAAAGFDEGPVTRASYRYLERRGVSFTRGVLRREAAAVIGGYAGRCGLVYNG